MNKASRMILARQLVYCAKMVLDAKQFKESRTITAIDDYTDSELSQELENQTASEAIKRLVKKPEKYSGWGYSRLRQAILEHDKDLQQYLNLFGIKNVEGSGYEIHHMSSGSHLIESGHCQLYYDIIRTKIDDNQYEIENQIKDIVIIPSWFHKRIENDKTANSVSLTDRKSYYIELKNCLSMLQKKKIPIKSLRFNNSNIHSAIKSLEKLALTVTDENKDKMIKNLYKCYKYLKRCVKELVNNIKL